jgi:hypothetical protein
VVVVSASSAAASSAVAHFSKPVLVEQLLDMVRFIAAKGMADDPARHGRSRAYRTFHAFRVAFRCRSRLFRIRRRFRRVLGLLELAMPCPPLNGFRSWFARIIITHPVVLCKGHPSDVAGAVCPLAWWIEAEELWQR